ncbi:MAG: GatB/YqeY domain-containing protein [Cytophagales bacterium]
MSLKEQVESEIKKAMLAKDKETLQALRGIKSLILLAETEKGASEALSQDAEIKLLMKAAKQRKESAEIYSTQGRKDLEEVELKELAVIEKFLPKQMSVEELESALKKIIADLGASSTTDMGKVMGVASKQLAGKADGKLISETVKKLLS